MNKKTVFFGGVVACFLIFPTCNTQAETTQSTQTRVNITITKNIQPLEHDKNFKRPLTTMSQGNKKLNKLPKTNEKASIAPTVIGALLLVLVSGILLARVIRLIQRKEEEES